MRKQSIVHVRSSISVPGAAMRDTTIGIFSSLSVIREWYGNWVTRRERMMSVSGLPLILLGWKGTLCGRKADHPAFAMKYCDMINISENGWLCYSKDPFVDSIIWHCISGIFCGARLFFFWRSETRCWSRAWRGLLTRYSQFRRSQDWCKIRRPESRNNWIIITGILIPIFRLYLIDMYCQYFIRRAVETVLAQEPLLEDWKPFHYHGMFFWRDVAP